MKWVFFIFLLLISVKVVQSCPSNVFGVWTCCPGYFNPIGTICNPASAGFFADGVSAYPCSAGTYCNTTALSAEYPCPIGSYCPRTSTINPLPCQIGAFCPFARMINPINCTSGSYCNGTSLTSPTSICPNGSYCPIRSIIPTICSLGYYCPSTNLSRPMLCPNGFYCNDTGIINNYLSCLNGSYCPQASIFPTPCPSGFYCPFRQMNSPILCHSGRYCPYNNTIVPTNCIQGQYCPTLSLNSTDGLINFTLCPKGFYCNQPQMIVPLPCTQGFYCENIGTIIPSLCFNGTYCPQGSITPTLCNQGYYCPLNTMSSLGPICSPGFYCPIKGLNFPVICPGGYFCSIQGIVSLSIGQQCPSGYYCPEGSINPIICPPGTYCNQSLLTTVSLCSQGYYCPTSGLIQSGYLCPNGTYCPYVGMSVAGINCPLGSYCPFLGMSTPRSCPEGFYCNSTNLIQPSGMCLKGQYCPLESNIPLGCPKGSYCSTDKLEVATICPLGYYCPFIGTIYPIPCPEGYYCPSVGLHVGTDYKCTSGHYCNGTTIQPYPCREGYFCLNGAINETSCDAGYYSNSVSSSCIPCEEGTFSNSSASYSCFICEQGTVSEFNQASTQCLDCPNGYFCKYRSSLTRSTECPNSNFYCPSKSSNPIPVDQGFYAYNCLNNNTFVGCKKQLPCESGYFCLKGQKSACELGKFQNKTQSTLCLDCLDSFVTISKASVECYSCGNGFIASSDHTQCIACSQGTYFEYGKCIECPLGKYSYETNSTQCIECPDGQYTLSTGSTRCLTCASGKYIQSTKFNSTDCLLCDVGKYSEQGSDRCIDCPIGSYSGNKASPFCSFCPSGTFSNIPSTSRCKSCSPGKYAQNSNSSSCTQCPDGFIASEYNTVTCTKCVSPSRADITQTFCNVSLCPRGTEDNGQGSCSPCKISQYSLGFGGICLPCPVNSFSIMPGSYECLSCLNLAGVDCNDGKAYIQKGFWGYLEIDFKSSRNIYVSFFDEPNYNQTLTQNQISILNSRIVLKTVKCTNDFCNGNYALFWYSEDIQTWYDYTNNPNPVSKYALTSNSQTCSENRDQSPDNIMCGKCASGYMEWHDQCIVCEKANDTMLLLILFLSILYLIVLYRISQVARSDASILIAFVQISLFQSGSLDQYISWLGFVNFGFFQSTGPRCLVPITPVEKFFIQIMFPAILLIELWIGATLHYIWFKTIKKHPEIIFFIKQKWSKTRLAIWLEKFTLSTRSSAMSIDAFTSMGSSMPSIDVKSSLNEIQEARDHKSFDMLNKQMENIDKRTFLRYKYIRTSTAILIFSYLQITSSALNFLNCITVDKTPVIVTSPSIHCDSQTYKLYFPLYLTLCIVVGFGFPFLNIAFLYYNRKKILENDQNFRSRFGNLYEKYKPDKWFWTTVILLRHAILIALSVIYQVDTTAKYLAFAFLNISYYISIDMFQPHGNHSENHMDRVAQIIILVTSVYFVGVSPPYSNSSAIFIAFLIIPYTLIGACIVIVLRLPFKWTKTIGIRLGFRSHQNQNFVGSIASVEMTEDVLQENPVYKHKDSFAVQ
jgi:hypothetical protein